MFKHYLKTAWRNLINNKVQSIIAIVGLAFGLFCFALTTYSTRIVNEANEGIPNYKRLAYLVREEQSSDTVPPTIQIGMKTDAVEQIKALQLPQIEAVCHVSFPVANDYMVLDEQSEGFKYKLYYSDVDSGFISVFNPQVIAGSWGEAANTPNSIVITRMAANKLFGAEEQAIGKQIRHNGDTWSQHANRNSYLNPFHMDGSKNGYTIRAVIEDIPTASSLSFFTPIDLLFLNDDFSTTLFRSISYDFNDGVLTTLGENIIKYANSQIYALLAPGTDLEKLSDHIFKQTAGIEEKCNGYRLQKAEPDEWEYNSLKVSFAPVVAAIGLLVLLICLLNYFTLLTGSWFSRMKEFSLRKLLGANGWRNFVMLGLQTLLLLVAATLLALLLREFLMPDEISFSGDAKFQLKIGRFILYLSQYIGLIALLSLAICAALSAYIVHSLARKQIARRNGNNMGRNIILTIQFIICWIFVSLSVNMQMQSSNERDKYYPSLSDEEKSAVFQLNWDDYDVSEKEQREALTQQILFINGVEKVSKNADVAVNWCVSAHEGFASLNVDTAFASLMNLHFVQGRMFRDKNEMVINDSLAVSKGYTLGEQLYNNITIVGIFEGAINNKPAAWNHNGSLSLENCGDNPSGLLIKAKPGSEGQVRKAVNRLLNEELPPTSTDGGNAYVKSLSQQIEENLNFELRYRSIILFVTLACLFITLIGVYAAISLDTERRRKEMAIRKINGARPWQIALLFVRRYLWLLTVSFVIAIPSVFYIAKLWKKEFDNGILFWAFLFISITLLTLATLSVKVWNIVKENPAEVVKRQ